jgi:phosphatidylglycerol lysyltransferase
MREEIDTEFRRARRIRHYVRYIIGLIVGFVGLTDMLSAIAPRLEWSTILGVWPIVPYRVHAQTYTVAVGFFLIMLSYGLARGKRHAWLISLALLLLSAVLHVQRSGSVLATVVALLLAAMLCVLASFFQAKSDPPSVWRGYIAVFLGLGIVTFYAIGGFLALFNDFEPVFDRVGGDAVIFHVLTFAHVHYKLHSSRAFFFEEALPILCVSAVVYGMFQLWRPVAAVLLPDVEEREQVMHLVRLYGTNSISYFALSEEKSYFFSYSGRTVISYVLEASTAVVAGDPIGPEEEIEMAIRQFVDFCSEQDWTIVFWQIRDRYAELYRKAGLHLLKIGEDAVVNVRNFTLKGGAMANVRTSAKRAEKDGVHVVFYHERVTDPELVAQMEQISHYWLTCKGGTEMGFSMGRFTPQGEPQQLYALAVDEANKVHAFVSFVPIYGRQGWGLDLMRRAEVCAPGTMELLLARSIEYMQNAGCEMVSLGLAPMSNANAEDESFLWSSIDSLTGRFGNPAKGRSLFNFKKKFQPMWESRYLVYSDTLDLPKIGLALYQAHQSDTTLIRMLRQSIRDMLRTDEEEHPGSAALNTAKV